MSEELDRLRRLLDAFEESEVWQHVRDEVERAREEDIRLLLGGTDRDERIRGGVAMADDILAIPERIRERVRELEEEEG